MSTYSQILYQIVFATRNREKSLTENKRANLFRIIQKVLESHKCHPYRINGIEDHIHIATHIHPTVALSDVVKAIKLTTSLAIKNENLFPSFNGWQEGYGAFTYSISSKNDLIEYIKNQEQIHQDRNFEREYKELLLKFEIEFNEKYLFRN